MTDSEEDETLESHGTNIGKRTSSVRRVKEWVLVEGNRLFVAALISLGVFVLFLVLNEVGFIAVTNDDTITRLAGGMIAGTFSLVTLVVSINQLILSQEFSSAGDARGELEGVMAFREDIEERADIPASPASPSRLLELVIEIIHNRTQTFKDAVDDDHEAASLIDQYTTRIMESTTQIDETLERTEFGTFRAMSAAVGYDTAWQLYVARQLRGRHDESFSEEASDSLEELIESLELFITTREHFKTTYLQRELTKFSQLTIYCGVPAILGAMILGFIYAGLTGPMVSTPYLPFVVSGLIAVVVSPLSLLVVYILRTATITRRTASIGPMLPQKEPEAGPFDVSDSAEDE